MIRMLTARRHFESSQGCVRPLRLRALFARRNLLLFS